MTRNQLLVELHELRKRVAELEASEAQSERLKKELRESEATARKLLDIPNVVAFLIDCHGICLDANEGMAKRFGRAVSELIGKSVWDLFPLEVRKRRMEHFKEVLNAKQQVRYEDEREGMWNESVITPILDENGEVIKVAVFGVDITERKQMEEELRRSHSELEQKVHERTAALREKSEILEEVNTALRVMLRQREADKRELEESIYANMRSLIVPCLEKLKKSHLSSLQLTMLEALESHLNEVTSPFIRALGLQLASLTPTEMRVAALIRDGKQTGEIAEILSLSEHTVSSHRDNIREKLGLRGTRHNLRSYLLTLA